MTWVGTAVVGGVGLIKGGVDAHQNKKAQKKHDAYRKAAIEMSPWTNMGDPGDGNIGNTNMVSGMLGGGAQGAAIGGALGKTGMFGGGGSAGAMGASPIAATTAPAQQLQTVHSPTNWNAMGGGMQTSLLNQQHKFGQGMGY